MKWGPQIQTTTITLLLNPKARTKNGVKRKKNEKEKKTKTINRKYKEKPNKLHT